MFYITLQTSNNKFYRISNTCSQYSTKNNRIYNDAIMIKFLFLKKYFRFFVTLEVKYSRKHRFQHRKLNST